MSKIRFATARDVFSSFTLAPNTIRAQPTDELPLDFLRGLVAKGKLEDALTFCGYLLPRREAVWWACRSVRALLGDAANRNAEGLNLAEAWVREPDPQHRIAAEEFSKTADRDSPMTWLASAAAWSGGVISMGSSPAIVPPPELTAHAARVAILLSARQLAPAERRSRLSACIDDGARLAETGL
jgi:hypothetical protein